MRFSAVTVGPRSEVLRVNGDGTSGICNNDEPASNGEWRVSVLKPWVMMTLVRGGSDDDAGWKRRTLLMRRWCTPRQQRDSAKHKAFYGVTGRSLDTRQTSFIGCYFLRDASGAQVRPRCVHLLTATYTLQPSRFRDHNARSVTLNSAVFSKNYVFLLLPGVLGMRSSYKLSPFIRIFHEKLPRHCGRWSPRRQFHLYATQTQHTRVILLVLLLQPSASFDRRNARSSSGAFKLEHEEFSKVTERGITIILFIIWRSWSLCWPSIHRLKGNEFKNF